MLENDLKGYIRRLAARTALHLISAESYPELVVRLGDFLQDRGAVGLLLDKYDATERIEDMARLYWQSRIEKSGARFEDIITTVIISTLTSIVAGIVVEAWKGEFGPLKRLLTKSDKRSLRETSRREPYLRKDLGVIFPIYLAKTRGEGIADPTLASQIYAAIDSGHSFETFINQNPAAVGPSQSLNILTYAAQIGRGVVLTEMARDKDIQSPNYTAHKTGICLSPYLAFGETISLENAIYPNSPQRWKAQLKEMVGRFRLYPNLWPDAITNEGPSPKILILKERTLEALSTPEYRIELLNSCAGFISDDSSETSHLAVLSRGLGVGGITCQLTDEERADAKFALFENGRLRVYCDRPNLVDSDFSDLLGAMSWRLKS